MDDEADGREAVAEVVDERTAAGVWVERPALAVQHETLLVLLRSELPQLLQADAVLLRVDTIAQVESLHQLLRERSAAALGEQRVFGVQLHSELVFALVRAILGDPHVARGDTAHGALVVVQDFGGRETGIDFHAERFRLLAEPAAHVAEARDVHAMVVHQAGQRPSRNPVRRILRQDQEAVLAPPACRAALPVPATRARARSVPADR